MKKLLSVLFCMFLIMPLFACGEESNPINKTKFTPDIEKGYTEKMPLRFTIADYKYGTEFPYARHNDSENYDWNARSFVSRTPIYNYTPITSAQSNLEYKSNSTWIDSSNADDCNYYTIYGAASGSGAGTVISDYLMYIPALDDENTPMSFGKYPKEYENYLDLSDYQKLFVTMGSLSSDNSDVSFKIYIKNFGNTLQEIISYSGNGFSKKELTIDISTLLSAQKDNIEFIRFEQQIDNIAMSKTIKNSLYFIEAYTDAPAVTRESVIAGINVKSEYLGNMLYTKWGAYSASGFYDSTDNKWKLWYGAGIPERTSSDNIFYTETTNLNKSWSKPKRITTDNTTGYKLIDPSGKLKKSDDQIGYGGDPSVIKVNGIYYMYFSALEKELSDGKYTHWNKIYVATSTDSKIWTVQGVPVDCASGGSLGYGAGGPSAVYYNNQFYLYYYTQAPDYRFPNESTGFVLKKSSDGVHYNEAIEIDRSMSACDVKYIPSLRKWVGTYYAEKNQFIPDAIAGIRIAFSDDGEIWEFVHSNDKMIAQNFNYPINHNPGFIGNELGHGYETMFLTYGANDLPLTVNGYWFSAAQYDARQLEWSRITIS